MLDTGLVILTSNIAQALGALVLALVLMGFHRLYQRRFLLLWAWSWGAFCASLLAGSAALHLTPLMPADAPLRFAASVLSMAAGYWQAAWLIFGTWEVLTGKLLSRRFLVWAPVVLLALAFATILGSLPMEPRYRVILRVGIKCLVLSIAFALAAWGVWRNQSQPLGFGRRMVSGAFLLYGLHQLHYLVILVSQLTGIGSMSYAAYLAPFDFLFQALVGIGMVIWLLEDERQTVLAASARIKHLAFHDSLTDLPNRNLLTQYLQAAVDRAAARRERLAVLFLDLDRFKVVNESMGNRQGDDLLKAFSERLRHNLRGTDLIARVAADEFAILLPAVETEGTPVRVADKLLGITRLPFALQGREIYLTASIGISRCPEDGTDAETLLKRAESAMYRAKETRRDSYQLYDSGMDSNSLEQISLEADLRRALAHEHGAARAVLPAGDGLGPGGSARRRGAAALAPPGARPAGARGVPVAGRGLRPGQRARPLGAPYGVPGGPGLARLGRARPRAGGEPLPRTFQQLDLLSRVNSVLAETGFPPCALVLEITETLAMQNAEATLAVLRGLKELGVKIAIDDFGTGYSSLSYLTIFPIDTLKVDRSFVHTLGKGRGGEEVAAAVIALAVSLGISVVAEGVEEEEQSRWLEGLGCERFQGYLFSRPLPAGECRDLVVRGALDVRIAPAAERLLSASL